MITTHRSRNLFLQVALVLLAIGVWALIATALLPFSGTSSSLTYKVLVTTGIAGVLALLGSHLFSLFTTITTDSFGVHRKTLLGSSSVAWGDIGEITRVHAGIGLSAAWRYYVRPRTPHAHSLCLGTHNVEHLDELLSTIIRNAPGASITQTHNDSALPFLRKARTEKWSGTA